MMSLRDARRIQAKAWRRYKRALRHPMSGHPDYFGACKHEWQLYMRCVRRCEALVFAYVRAYKLCALTGLPMRREP